MPVAIFELPDGTEHTADVPEDWSLMEAARRDGLEGIVAECGGGAICGTCHVHVGEQWFDQIEPASPTEDALLEVVPERSPTSRLSCQVIMTPALDGIRVRVPAEQLSM
ncbi:MULTISPECIES: 2Fe-2S iron-sulfur cluster-binding protein [unclassified Bordetella]|uniref:2Fe-2S iron-sulfur cluster-binding protein n=1 Tax=unclassified Bordetella TaxID=2630031 RepID=UPI0013281BCD|nr:MULTISPECIES: 2Fe-2S iron-sulfur cluster-binding protein [unclassified Bordetella]MVW69912.1 2Fe-2S iron-sulfur cluster binding domain-containing protein [Bordetella sp. 15P40C-2]MVW77545.1 2Fe-2S iron-sulfur cluster binding domain-containing protein [Bordetella sp. 02P26C-1]